MKLTFTHLQRYLALFSGLMTLTGFLGCSDSQLKKYFLLDSFRVIALETPTPEIQSGDSVQLIPWVSDPKGAGRNLYITLESCIDPGVALGVSPLCQSNTLGYQKVISAQTATGLSAPFYTGAIQTLSLSTSNTLLIQNGVLLINVTVADQPDLTLAKDIIRSYRLIKISTTTPKQTNPILTDILIQGQPMTSIPTQASDLSMQISAASFAPTQTPLITTWFVSSGEVETTKIIEPSSTLFTPSIEPKLLMIGVTRDNLYGLSVIQKSFF